MKKKMIILGVLLLVLVIVVVALLLLKKDKFTTITLDINPSIEIKLKDDEVKEVKALNEDGEKVIESVEDDMNLDKVLSEIMNKAMEKDYIHDDIAYVLVHVDGKYDLDILERYLSNPLNEKNIALGMIVIDKITKEDRELANEYNISPTKAAYIRKINKENNIEIDYLVNRSITEIRETAEFGVKCEEGWTLKGTTCLKEIGMEKAKEGKVCPGEYLEYDGKCYREVPIEETDNYTCHEDRSLEGDKCIYEFETEPIPKSFSCSVGELTKKSDIALAMPGSGDDGFICVDKSKGTHPMSPCELHDGTETTMSGGKCYWHRADVLSGQANNGCPDKDIRIGNFCWDDASNVLVCKGARDGKQYSSRNEYCEDSIKYTEPMVSEYTCENGYSLKGTKCTKREEEPAEHEKVCPSGYRKVNNDRCIDETKVTELVDGYVCDKEDTELRGENCITFERKEAIKY